MRNARLALTLLLATGALVGASPVAAHGSCSGTAAITTVGVAPSGLVSGTGSINCTATHDRYTMELTFQYRTTPGAGGWTTIFPTFFRTWENSNSTSVSWTRSVSCLPGVREWRVLNHWTAGDVHSGSVTPAGVVVVCL